MISSKLEKLKKNYRTTGAPDWLKTSGWLEIERKLEPQKIIHPRYSLSFAPVPAFALLILVGFLVISQYSKPGTKLYPVKILSDKVYSQITGDYEATIEKRAQEVIEQSNTENGSFEEAKKHYEEAIEEAKEKRSNDEEAEKQQLRKKLEEQEKKFKELKMRSTNSDELQKLEDLTKRKRGEVKGEKDQKNEKENDREIKIKIEKQEDKDD